MNQSISNRILIIFSIIICLGLISCEKEEELSNREVVESELREFISNNGVNRMLVYYSDNRLDDFSSSWSFDNGFLILDNRNYYDLDKLRSYELEKQGSTITIKIRFI